MAQVDLQKLTKVYPGRITAVNAIDLIVADREFVVLVGPSGCGKTTTLRMIAGLEEITGGSIHIGQQIVNDLPPRDRDVAMVFQNYALYPHMSVYKNMAFGLKLRRLPAEQIRQRVMDVAASLEIHYLLERKPKALSGGQRQRVALGRAIVREPAEFLFDEPLSNLDAKLRVTTRAELKRLHQRLRTTTIYVTHDQEEAMTLGDRIVVMKDGKILQADPPLVTYNSPVNRFVAGFIGMPPMNFFDGVLKPIGDDLVFHEGLNVPSLSTVEPEGRTLPYSGGSTEQGCVAKSADQLTPGGNGFTISVSPVMRGCMAAHVGAPIVLGVRPEHLHLRPISDASAKIEARLNVIEPLGNNMDLYASTCLHDQVVARVEAQSGLQADSRVTLYVDPRKVHFFAPGETGMNLSQTNELSHALA
jgi:multiple sugar transport system ATP-binding protein